MRRAIWIALVIAGLLLAEVSRAPIGRSGGPLPSDLRALPVPDLRLRPGLDVDGASEPRIDLAALADVYGACTSLAYQSWANSNWEIYLARGDGSSPTRLTQNSAADEAPSLEMGCQLLAFASKRDGNYEIYTMRADGSQATRLTTCSTPDRFPSLSPTGSQIAYQSTESGANPDIYRIAVTGGSATQLTTDSAYDGQPDWSPDGTKIAFISGRSGYKNVWVMDADGSTSRQVTTLTYAGGPKWSPDGQRIAFAADDLDTGFTSLWVVDADGSDPRLVWRAAQTYTDAWPNDWSFDGRYIVFERTTWYYDGGWYISSAALEAINPDNTSDRSTLIEGGINLGASWALCDVQAPVSRVATLPVVSAPPFTVSWSGSDDYSSTLEYQVAFRLGGTASWVNWPIAGAEWTTMPSGRFDWNRVGAVLYFRSRARDEVGRIEAWPGGADGDTYTTVPALINGVVSDQRDVGVPAATVSGPAPYTQPAKSALDGQYVLRAASEGRSVLGVSADGYRSQSLALAGLAHLDGLRLALHTEPDLVQNGGFESGQANWFATLGVAFEPSGNAFEQRVARLGRGAGLNGPTSSDLAAAIWQQVKIPAEMHAPTLSLMAVLGEGASAGTLQSLITTPSGETSVIALSQPAVWVAGAEGVSVPLWQHAYADLSPWAGQTVTLTLRYTPGWSGSPCLLDEVSISPWYTPRVDSVAPQQLTPGSAATLTVRGANLDSTAQVRLGSTILTTHWVDAATLQATAPPTLPLGIHDLEVTNSNGYRSGLVRAVRIGSAAYLPVLLGAP